jgi:serine/threonine protein kinase
VAIKVLPADRVSDADRRRRFVQEAQAASALNHPHIITIYEIESAHGNDFSLCLTGDATAALASGAARSAWARARG